MHLVDKLQLEGYLEYFNKWNGVVQKYIPFLFDLSILKINCILKSNFEKQNKNGHFYHLHYFNYSAIKNSEFFELVEFSEKA